MLDTIPRKERPFLILTTTFIACLAILNLIGITKLIHIGPLTVAVGVLPYPITFLCTDLISEIYGQKRANFVVWLGLFTNIFILFILALAHALPAADPDIQFPWQSLSLADPVLLANGTRVAKSVDLIEIIYTCTTSSIFASMLAYFVAQFTDVMIFHRLKKMTNGKMLWLRNNISTLTSQLLDTTIVIGAALALTLPLQDLVMVIISSYAFKLIMAILDTPLFYLGVSYIGEYIRSDP